MKELGYSNKTLIIAIALLTYSSFCGVPTALADNDSTTDLPPNFFVQDSALELGYLNAEQIAESKENPYAADNEVTSLQMNADNFPLIPNPEDFDDEFNPGDFSQWQVVQLSPETGAVCGNGSPYKFFVNRKPKTTNMIIYFEPGGACVDYESCTGETGIRGARNPNGIPDNYLDSQGTNTVSPLISSGLSFLAPQDHVEPVEWTAVYMPYCTGDIFSGDTVALYVNPDNPSEKLPWLHNGVRNVRAVLAWLKNNLPKPPQMLATGCSSGGVGSLTNYPHLRQDLDPIKGFLIDDSGPVYNAPLSSNRADHPSLPLHLQIRESWGLDNGAINYLSERLPSFDTNNMGSIYGSMANQFPNDRMAHTQFWEDRNFSSYSYERLHPEMALGNTPNSRWPILRTRWERDTHNLIAELDNYPNFGYYIPRQRNFNESHCTTIVTFHNTEIDELDQNIQGFIANVLDGSGPIIQASETDRNDPGYFSLILKIAGAGLPPPAVVQQLDEPVVIEFSNSFTEQGFGNVEPGSGALVTGANHNNRWLIDPNGQTQFLRFVNLSTAKTLNNESYENKVHADSVVPYSFWAGQWHLQFTTRATNEFVLGARHGAYIYLHDAGNGTVRTQHAPNIFSTSDANSRSKWQYSAKFLSELELPVVRTRDVATLINRRSGSILYDPGQANANVAKFAPLESASRTKWLIESMAAPQRFIIFRNAETNRPLNIERANGELQLGNLPVRFWSLNWKVDETSEGYASFENRWGARRHRFYVPEGETSGITKEAGLDVLDSRAEWSYQPAYEVVDDFEIIPIQSR